MSVPPPSVTAIVGLTAESLPAQANLDRLRRENIFGKASRSRVEDVLAIFRQRFLGEEGVTKALVVLVQKHLPAMALDRILYFHAAQADRLLHDTVIEILLPLQARGINGSKRHVLIDTDGRGLVL